MVTYLVDVLTHFAVNLLVVIAVFVLGMSAAAICVERESHWHEDRSAANSDRFER
jgi:hypothetical protein